MAKTKVKRFDNPNDNDDELTMDQQASMSNEALISRLEERDDENIQEIIVRFRHAIHCLAYPQHYYKSDVDKFVAGEQNRLFSIGEARARIKELEEHFNYLTSPDAATRQRRLSELMKNKD